MPPSSSPRVGLPDPEAISKTLAGLPLIHGAILGGTIMLAVVVKFAIGTPTKAIGDAAGVRPGGFDDMTFWLFALACAMPIVIGLILPERLALAQLRATRNRLAATLDNPEILKTPENVRGLASTGVFLVTVIRAALFEGGAILAIIAATLFFHEGAPQGVFLALFGIGLALLIVFFPVKSRVDAALARFTAELGGTHPRTGSGGGTTGGAVQRG